MLRILRSAYGHATHFRWRGRVGASALHGAPSPVPLLELPHELHQGVDAFLGEGVVDRGAQAAYRAVALEAVEAGLSPMEALQAATLNPARFLGKEKDLGTVEKGKIADLIVLEANPLEKIGNSRKIDAVVIGGKLLLKADLRKMLADIEAVASKR